MPKALDLTGIRFGRLVAVKLASTGKRRKWECVCDCGAISTPTSDNLRAGNTTACGGCRASSKTSFVPVHGASVAKTPTYRTWLSMRRRVATKPEYAGVTIDPRWDDFRVFLEDMGERPVGKTIDRVDNSAGYSRQNCRWASPLQQTRNRRIAKTFTIDGQSRPIAEWAKQYGISYGAAYARIKRHGTLDVRFRSIQA